MRSMMVQLPTKFATGATSAWCRVFNLFFKREIRAKYWFSPAKVRAGNRKEIARELREEIMLMRS